MTVRICFLKIIWNQAANELECSVSSGSDFATLLFAAVLPLPLFFLVFLHGMTGRLQPICKH